MATLQPQNPGSTVLLVPGHLRFLSLLASSDANPSPWNKVPLLSPPPSFSLEQGPPPVPTHRLPPSQQGTHRTEVPARCSVSPAPLGSRVSCFLCPQLSGKLAKLSIFQVPHPGGLVQWVCSRVQKSACFTCSPGNPSSSTPQSTPKEPWATVRARGGVVS